MTGIRRGSLAALTIIVMYSASGCFLFGGGKKESGPSLEGELLGAGKGQQMATSALDQAQQALEEGNFDNVVINYNRAIQADSSNLDLYIDLASVHEQLTQFRREEGNVDAALLENQRGIKVLEALVKNRLKSGASTGAPAPAAPTPAAPASVDSASAPAAPATTPQ